MRRVTLVTGGARRLGAAIVRSFAAAGDALVVHYGSSAEEAETLAAELRRSGTDVVLVQGDLRDPAAPERIVAEAMRAFGQLDVVISSASRMMRHTLDQVTADDWDTVHAINLRAPFFLMRAAGRVMSDGGVIVQMADHLAHETGFPTLYPHQISKSAIPQLVRVMAQAFAPRIRVNAVEPGLVLAPADLTDAKMTKFLADVPLGRSGSPDDVIGAIHYLVNAPYVTGTVLTVDGGRRLRR
jgi:pteridine reductase